jgi:competence ComEA-like helix-hairpin-helix protein
MRKYYMALASIVVVVVLSTPLFAAKGIGYETWGVINANTATAEQLEGLYSPQGLTITKELAKAIVDYRNSNGLFRSLDDLISVKGMTRTKLDDLRPWLVLEGDTTYFPQQP